MQQRRRSARSAPRGSSHPNPTGPAWSRLLRGLREACGVTQEGWAARLGVSGATVQRWERGVSVPHAEQEQAIIALGQAHGLFRVYHEGPLRGLTLTPELLHDLLLEARLSHGPPWPAPVAAPSRPVGTPPPATGGRTNLPALLTCFVGREREIAALADQLATTRLLTLSGPGGVGKTRLALEVATAARERFPDGVWLVDLATLPTAPHGNGTTHQHVVHEGPQPVPGEVLLVQQVVAATLGIRVVPARPLADTLITTLRDRHLLLVLDNCEHLLLACAQLAEMLLHACPALRVLATSREALGIPGEVIWRVAPLSVPALPPGQIPLADAELVSRVMAHDAARLFVERARAVQPLFRVTPANAAAVARICARLDGLPLALELAAARLNVLSVEQVAAGLADRFRLLATGSRTAPPRHQSLRAAFDWSHALLSPKEQTLFRRLAVFAGSWTLAEAEAICAADVLPGLAAHEVLDLITRLVDKSLVLVEPPGERGDRPRYRLLETVRQYAAEQLQAAGEATRLGDHHRDWYLALAERAAPHLREREQKHWLEQLAAAHDNLRLALAWSLHRRAAEPGLRLAVALGGFWYQRGHWTEGQWWLTRFLAQAEEVPAALRMRALAAAGMLAHVQGDYSYATTALEQSLALARALSDWDQIALVLARLGDMFTDRGDLPRAIALLEEAVALARERSNDLLTAHFLRALAKALLYQDELARAAAACEESQTLSSKVGDRDGMAATLHNRALIAWRQRDYARAAAALTEALAIFQELGDRRSIAFTLGNLALVANSHGDVATAAADGAESVRRFSELDDRLGLGLYITVLAGVALLQRRPLRAARLAGAAEAIRESIGATLPAYVQPEYAVHLARLRASLGEAVLAAAWAEGRSMTVDQAVALALTDAVST